MLTKQPHSFPPPLLSTPNENNYFPSQFVHCAIIREKQAAMNHRFYFLFQAPIGCSQGKKDVLAMIAEKQTGSRSSHYRIWDTTRIDFSDIHKGSEIHDMIPPIKLNKKSGNYLGKLRRDKSSKTINGFSIYDATEEKNQIGAFVYQKTPLMQQMKDGHPPRNIRVAIPQVDVNGQTEQLAPYLKNRLVECIENETKTGIYTFQNKEPMFQKGKYRLNFSGRVTLPSVKNLQLIQQSSSSSSSSSSDKDNDSIIVEERNMNDRCRNNDVILQFGKVGENRYHLDYRKPFNAYQSFALALSAIDL